MYRVCVIMAITKIDNFLQLALLLPLRALLARSPKKVIAAQSQQPVYKEIAEPIFGRIKICIIIICLINYK